MTIYVPCVDEYLDRGNVAVTLWNLSTYLLSNENKKRLRKESDGKIDMVSYIF